MNKILLAALVGFGTLQPALAQQKADDHAAHHAASGSAAARNAGDMTDAEVRRVDKEGGKITLKHAEIKSLDMPPMTMVFQVKDKAWLDKLKTGDKVRFKAIQEAGSYRVTDLEVVP